MSGLPIKLGANSLQFLARASGLVGPDGLIKKNLSLDAPGFRINSPAEAFPFIDPNEPVMVILTLVQVRPDKEIETEKKLIIPNA